MISSSLDHFPTITLPYFTLLYPTLPNKKTGGKSYKIDLSACFLLMRHRGFEPRTT